MWYPYSPEIGLVSSEYEEYRECADSCRAQESAIECWGSSSWYPVWIEEE